MQASEVLSNIKILDKETIIKEARKATEKYVNAHPKMRLNKKQEQKPATKPVSTQHPIETGHPKLPGWQTIKKQQNLRTEGTVTNDSLLASFEKNGITYSQTKDGYKATIADAEVLFNPEANNVTLNHLERKTLTKISEICADAGSTALDLSSLVKDFEKDPDKYKKLYEIYAGIKDANKSLEIKGKSLEIKGLDPQLMADFGEQYKTDDQKHQHMKFT